MIPSLSLYRFIQLIAGLSTASSFFFLSLRSHGQGDPLAASVLFLIGVFGFILPGLLMNRSVTKFRKGKAWLVNTVKQKLGNLLPSIPLLP